MIAVIVIVAILLAISFVISLLGRSNSPRELLRQQDPRACNDIWRGGDGGHHGKNDWDQGTFG